ncbi:DUF5343 domain-containing protein [Steroidobacter cummioxidans]|uniref:DUF5343 domain-containing protein n=1 Tax=Steroidobacter cummioxidans TaxID=1803913 RepID=UPI00129016BB|nr:DUF5343 domain-containing protein [Steroidobacter cummioxidans]
MTKDVGSKGGPHPYVPSTGMIVQTFAQLRKMFPSRVDAETLKKLSLAPGNESVVINVLRFLGLVDEQGKKTSLAGTVFSKHQDDAFASELEKVVKEAYAELFDTMGAAAWGADRSSLIGFFRVHDETSELTATRQSIAFETLASLSGHGETVKVKAPAAKTSVRATSPKKRATKPADVIEPKRGLDGLAHREPGAVGLTVRIEINLPAQGDQETYDRIFQSIKRNLLNA